MNPFPGKVAGWPGEVDRRRKGEAAEDDWVA